MQLTPFFLSFSYIRLVGGGSENTLDSLDYAAAGVNSGDNSNMKLMKRQELRVEEKNIVNGCMV